MDAKANATTALDIADLVPGDFLIDQTIASPVSVDETLLAGTPLQSTIRVASGAQQPADLAACPRPRQAGAMERCTASANAETLSLSLFEGAANPLPAITVQLAGAGSTVAQDLQGAPVHP